MDTYLYKDLYDLEETHWWHRAKRQLLMGLIRKYATSGKRKIVDIGCGTGKNVESFASLGDSWGVDMSKEAIDFCKKRGLKNVAISKGEKTPLDFLEHIERFIYKIARINPNEEMNWKAYIKALLMVNLVWFIFGFTILLIQGFLPLCKF